MTDSIKLLPGRLRFPAGFGAALLPDPPLLLRQQVHRLGTLARERPLELLLPLRRCPLTSAASSSASTSVASSSTERKRRGLG